MLFFVFGFVMWLNSILIPYFKITLELNNTQSTWVTFAFFISYFAMALPSSWVLNKTGFRNGLVLGLWIMALGALIFIPAAFLRMYSVFLLGLFVMGAGLALLQTAANPYVTILGSHEGAAQRMSIMGVSNKLAGIVSQRVLGGLFLLNADKIVEKLKTLDEAGKIAELNSMALRVVNPYLIMAASLLIISIIIRLVGLPEIDNKNESDHISNDENTPIWRFPNLILGVIALFFAVGAEVIAGDYIITYGITIGIPFSIAKHFTKYILISMLVGYASGIFLIPKYLRQDKALLFFAASGIIFSIGAILTSGYTSIGFVILMGFSNAILWPAIWPLALKGIGGHTKRGSAFLIMAISGGAILPIFFGRIMDTRIPSFGFIITIVCYSFILYYSLAGHKLKDWDFRKSSKE